MKSLLILIIALLTATARADIDPGFVKFCESASNLQSIAGSMPNIMNGVSPLPPFGGVVIGMVQNSNALKDMCSFVINFSEFQNSGKIELTKNLLHEMTGDEFDKDFQMIDKSFNILTSVYDFDNGKNRPGAMTSARELNDLGLFAKDMQIYIAEKQMTEADKRQAQQNGYVSDAQLIAQIAGTSANLKSALNCPAPYDGNDYGDLYDKNVAPEERLREVAMEDVAFYTNQLVEMGRFMSGGESGMFQMYMLDLNQLSDFGVTINKSAIDPTYTEKTMKPTKLTDAQGHVIKKEVILKKTYQQYTHTLNSTLFSKFISNYGKQWLDSVRVYYLTNIKEFGILNPAARVQNKFRDFSFECRERLLMQGYAPTNSDYNAQFQRRRTDCEKNIQLDQKKVENLLNYYVNTLQNALYQEKKSTSTIWTFESRYMNINRMANVGVVNEEQVKCAENLSPAQMEELALKQEAVNIELRTIIARKTQEKTSRKEMQAKQRAKQAEESQQKARLIRLKAQERERIADQVTPTLSPIRAGTKKK